MKKGTQIKIEKLSSSEKPEFPTPKKEDYKPGQDNGYVSLPAEYWCIGVLDYDIEVGKPVSMLRSNRNGVEAFGQFISSPVSKIEGNIINTANSVYQVTVLN